MEIMVKFLVVSSLYFLITETKGTILQSNGNHVNKKCSKCPPGWGVVKRCTRDADTHCVKCTQGKTYSSNFSSKSPCWSCSQCGVGLYESHRCSPVRDTICNECISYLDLKNLTNNNDFKKQCSYLLLMQKNS